MKKCTTCKQVKPTSKFHKNRAKADGLQGYCKSCMKERNARYYRETPEKNAARNQFKERTRRETAAWVNDYKSSNPCVDCGESDPIVLEFDHVRGEKVGNVSGMVGASMSLAAVIAEVAKCEVRCANCHRRVTHARRIAK